MPPRVIALLRDNSWLEGDVELNLLTLQCAIVNYGLNIINGLADTLFRVVMSTGA